MKLRITTGTLKGRTLALPAHEGLRPTTGMGRQMLFNILGTSVDGSAFLDLYAGTGSVGFEAVSRGAERVVFVEKDPVAAGAIREAAERFSLVGRCAVIQGDASVYPRPGTGLFDIAFLDPPYDLFPAPGLTRLAGLVTPGGLLVYEHSSRKSCPAPEGFELRDCRKAGDSAFSFFVRQPEQRKD